MCRMSWKLALSHHPFLHINILKIRNGQCAHPLIQNESQRQSEYSLVDIVPVSKNKRIYKNLGLRNCNFVKLEKSVKNCREEHMATILYTLFLYWRLRVSITVTNTVTKYNLWKRGFISSHSFHVCHWGRSRQENSKNLEAGADAEVMEDYCLPTCFLRLLSLLSHRT